MQVLDVGCGLAKQEGAIGVDTHPLPGVDVVHNLEEYPWPFEDDRFDEVLMHDIIEHLPDTIKTMEECFRILKPGGLLKIRVVPYNHYYAYSDPTHVKFFTDLTWKFFTGEWRSYYTPIRFEMVSLTHTFDTMARALFRSERLMRFLSRYLWNIIDGMYVILRKPEDAKGMSVPLLEEQAG